MQLKTIITLLSISAIGICNAQDSLHYKNTYQVNWGLSTLNRQDILISPFAFSDVSIGNFGIKYRRDAKLWQEFSLTYNTFNTINGESFEYYNSDSTIAETYPSYHTYVNLDYYLGKELYNTEKIKYLAGGRFSNNIDASNINYGRNGAFAYFANFGIDIWGAMQYQFDEKNGVYLRLGLPVFSWVARSPYLLNDDEFIENISSHKSLNTFFAYLGDGNLATWNTIQSLDLLAEYNYHFYDQWVVGFAYGFNFLHYSKPLPLTSYENRITLTINYSF